MYGLHFLGSCPPPEHQIDQIPDESSASKDIFPLKFNKNSANCWNIIKFTLKEESNVPNLMINLNFRNSFQKRPIALIVVRWRGGKRIFSKKWPTSSRLICMDHHCLQRLRFMGRREAETWSSADKTTSGRSINVPPNERPVADVTDEIHSFRDDVQLLSFFPFIARQSRYCSRQCNVSFKMSQLSSKFHWNLWKLWK